MAEYDMQETTLAQGTGEMTVRYPRMRLYGRLDTDAFLRQVASHTTFSPAELRAAVQLLASGLADTLAQGYSVHLDGLGSFTPTLGLRPGAEPETGTPGETRRNATSICVDGIAFKPDRQLVRLTDASCRLKRTAVKARRSSTRYTPDQRLQLARQYLAEHAEMSLICYCALTGLLKDKASRELRRWEQSPHETGIRALGRGPAKRWTAADIHTEG